MPRVKGQEERKRKRVLAKHVTVTLSKKYLMRANYTLGAILSTGHTGPVFALVFMLVVDVARVRVNMWIQFL